MRAGQLLSLALCVLFAAHFAASLPVNKAPTTHHDLSDVQRVHDLLAKPIPEIEMLEIGDTLNQVPYLPSSGLFSNPATDTKEVPMLPQVPACTIRSTTVAEVQRMRADAAHLGASVHTEVINMDRRKTYIEQMTQYLNDRIRELNKVKRDLAKEVKWIAVTNHRITELAEKEKLVKLNDIMQCVQTESARLKGDGTSKEAALAGLKSEAAAATAAIKGIRGKIKSLTDAGGAGGEEAGGSEAASGEAS